jgi:alanyl aminopeptidase
MVATIAHEVAHQWFGNWVTMRWWDDLWLNESFATWITPKVVDAWRPAYRLSLEGVRDKAAAMEVDALAAARKIRQPVQSSSEASEAFDRITYEKGAAVLAMIESWIGPERFQKGVRRYLRRHAWRHATARDLLRALARAGRADVGAVAESFLDQPGLPLVSLEPACESGRLTLRLQQRPFAPKGGGRAAGADGARWRVPVCVRLVAEGAPAETLCALVGADGAEVEREVRRCPVAIVPNALERGYYRWQLPPEWMARLRSAPLEVAERAGVVANAVALLEAGEAPVDAVLDELVGYAADPDWIVVERVVDALEKVNDALVDEVGRPGFREVVRRALGGTAERLGWKPRAKEDADTRLLRAKVLWAMGGLAEDPRALAEAERIASAYLRDRASVDPDLAPVAALLASRRGDERRLEAWAAIVESAKLPSERLVGLRGLAGFTRPDLARRALDLTLTDKVRQQDVVRVVEKMLAHHATREIAYAWLKERFEDLRRKVPEVRLAGVYTSFGKLGSAALRADAAAFFGAPARRLAGGERRLAEGLELLDVALALRAREGERARAYFERAAGK